MDRLQAQVELFSGPRAWPGELVLPVSREDIQSIFGCCCSALFPGVVVRFLLLPLAGAMLCLGQYLFVLTAFMCTD